ncbi:LamG-like jellyroll fold domain-containing protein [Pedobacter ghigonis]|uniref:LamG-like jellyroll fold domain-containing protein n=1 Tax=Pedobacter ghigonis TaxID=2730403 RepID=UPI00158E0B19|nr:LamG-like jellyroll fold domain-containing protein [Pedobacter ghigonis]
MGQLKIWLSNLGTWCVSVCFFAFVLLGSACNKNFDNVIPVNTRNDTVGVSSGKPKVLYIILDGVKGSAVAAIKPPKITEINKNAIYSFVGLTDSTQLPVSNAGAWASLTTGVDPKFHKVSGDSFVGNDLTTYPTLFTRIKQEKPKFATVSYAASGSFTQNLAGDATEKQTLASDAEVKTSTLAKLKDGNADLIVAQFHGAETVGLASGYTETNTAYSAAIVTLDTYIGEMVAALKARATFRDENWLVVIASNKGGATNNPRTDFSLFGDDTRNTYVALYNPKFAAKLLGKPNTTDVPYAGSAPRFQSTDATKVTASLTSTTVGNFGTTGDYVVMFKIRNDAGSDAFWPPFLGKRSTFSGVGSGGYLFSFSGKLFQFDFADSSRPDVNTIRDGQWHTIAIRLSMEGGKRFLRVYSDGVRSTNAIYPLDVTTKLTDNTSAFRIGAEATVGKATNFLLRDLAIFKVAMTDAEVINYMKREVTVNHPYFANLEGWWPCKEGTGFLLKDRSGKNNDFVLTSNATWATFNDLSPNINPEIVGAAYRTVPNNVDLPFQIYNWLGILPRTEWNLSGKAWPPTFTDVLTN